MSLIHDNVEQEFRLQIKRMRVPAEWKQNAKSAFYQVQTERRTVGRSRVLPKVKMLGASAAGVILLASLFLGVFSPSVSAMLNVPLLRSIKVAFHDISLNPRDPAVTKSTVQIDNPYGTGAALELQIFPNYDKAFAYVGSNRFPTLVDEQIESIMVRKYNDSRFNISASAKTSDGTINLNVFVDLVNLPTFEGGTVSKDEVKHVVLNGVEAEVFAFHYTNNDSVKTTFLVWNRNNFTMVLSGWMSDEKLLKYANDVDRQAASL